jgi:hypothetical protein
MADGIDVKKGDDYTVGTGSGDIRLAVTIGEGQQGRSFVKLAGSEIVRGAGSLAVKLGPANKVKGKAVVVRSAVGDVLSATNKMSVTCRLQGGPAPKSVQARGSVTEEGDSLVFEITIDLV